MSGRGSSDHKCYSMFGSRSHTIRKHPIIVLRPSLDMLFGLPHQTCPSASATSAASIDSSGTVGRQHAACTDATKQAVNESIPAETVGRRVLMPEGAAPQIKPAVNV
jgi:hypothetical protein